jgi:TonB family protein
VVVPGSKPFRSEKILNAVDRAALPETSVGGPAGLFRNPEPNSTVLALKESIASGGYRLDAMLTAIADAARRQTGASGAALAMWKEGTMVCRARSGETAPPLGALLNSETGISGECLRSGETRHCVDTKNDPLVDAEVCRQIGLRSIVVLPIQGWRGVNGILEVSSTRPFAFGEQHISVLQHLAALAERARAAQPHGASAAVSRPQAEELAFGLLPASDRVGDVALAFFGPRSRPFVLGLASLLAIGLIALVIWLGWRGPDETVDKAQAAATPPTTEALVGTAEAHPAVDVRPPANEQALKPSAGVSRLPSGGKTLTGTQAGTPVKLAAKVDVLEGDDQLIRRVPPVYPSEARLQRLEGTVTLLATVMEDGSVDDVQVVDGPPVLAQSAVEAVKRWRYKPFEVDGKPVTNQIRISVDFKLPD